MFRKIALTMVGALALTTGLGTRAEVRVFTDRQGNYATTRVLRPTAVAGRRLVGTERETGIWRPVGRGASLRTLNPEGDRRGDLWPLIVEPASFPHHPWVFWSRLNGSHYDLVWSRWSNHGWSPASWVWSGSPGDDLDPHVVFDEAGRAYATWWAEDHGRGRVLVSAFSGTTWTVPVQISADGVDARHPLLELGPTELVIRYRSPVGLQEFVISLLASTSITDDINPLENEQNQGALNGPRRLIDIFGADF